MVGGYALRYALDSPAAWSVTAIGRRKIGISHPRLKEVLHQDFADCSALAQALSGQDAAVFCLGAYTGTVSDADLRRISVDYTNRVHASSPSQRPRRGILILEWEWGGSHRPKSKGFRALQG